MATIDLNHLRVLTAVHERGSFSSAALALGVPRSTVSRAIAALEETTGVPLFHRTTRRIDITDEARVLVERLGASLQTIESALQELPGKEAEPRGTLKITATADLGSIVLAEAVARFTARWPQVKVDVVLSSKVVDLARDGFDLALRVSAGALRDSALVARKVGRIGFRLYASPSYVARRGPVRSLDELAAHDWVGFRGTSLDKVGLRVTPRIVCDDMFFVRETLRRGGGVGGMPHFLADPEVASGALVNVLPRWTWATGTVYLVRPQKKQVPARTTAFSELVVEMLRRNPL